MSQCDCDVCYYARQVNLYINKIEDEDVQNFFMNMYDMLIHAEMDKDYYQAIVKNQWPDSDRILKKYRKEV